MKKKPLLILVIFIAVSRCELQAQIKTVFDQLAYVNAEWQNQSDVDPLLKTMPALPLTEQKLIQLHLIETERLLRKRSNSTLSKSQQQSRLRNLDILHQYTLSGQFPNNNLHNSRQPYFIDTENTHCAVGYLMKMSGAEEMAKQISSIQNYNYLIDIHHTKLMDWVSKTGLTFDELALIQPSYGGEWPSCIVEMHYNNIGQDIDEYIEVHQSTGALAGMNYFTDILFCDHVGTLYKTVNINQMQFTTDMWSRYYHFPVNENFLDSGKVILMSNSDTLSVYTYNSSEISLHDYHFNSTRHFATIENDDSQVGNSLTFCGLYSTTWNTNILPTTIGSMNACTIGAVPVTLISFDYSMVNNSVNLNWQTASEFNSDYFELQRSTDGINFSPIGKIKASGTSNISKYYTFTDAAPLYLNHYRLKQVDLDGKSSFSKILFVRLKNANPFAIIQNQVSSSLQVRINTVQSATGNLTIHDLLGRVVFKTNAKIGVQNINVMGLAPATYLISLDLKDGQIYTLKFEKI